MEPWHEAEYRAFRHLLNTIPGQWLAAEDSEASATNIPTDVDPLVFEGEDMSLAWLDDILPTTDQMSGDLGLRSNGETENTGVDFGYTTPPALQTCQTPQGPCIGLAIGTLKSLRASSPSCLMGSQNRQRQLSPAVDSVLSATQDALQAMRDLLKCPCHESPQLQLLVTVICVETIAWYRRCISTYSRHRDTNMEGGIRVQEEEEEVSLLRRPFFIGDHRLKGHMERTLIGQVICDRLQEAEDVMREIARNTGQAAAATGVDDTESSHTLLEAVYIRRDSFFNTKLSAARRELAELQYGTFTGEAASLGTHG